MGNNSTFIKPSKELYDKAVSGDCHSIQMIARFYKENDLPFKALEWLRYGANKGIFECMLAAAATAISVSYDYIMPDNMDEALCLDLYVEARYWLSKVYEEIDIYIDEEEDRAKLDEYIRGFDSKLGRYYYDYAIKDKNITFTSIPEL